LVEPFIVSPLHPEARARKACGKDAVAVGKDDIGWNDTVATDARNEYLAVLAVSRTLYTVKKDPNTVVVDAHLIPRQPNEFTVACKTIEANERDGLVEQPLALVGGSRPEVEQVAALELACMLWLVGTLQPFKRLADAAIDAGNVERRVH